MFITHGPDGNLWFTEQGASPGVATMAITGNKVTEFHVTGSAPQYLVSGPALNTLVFTDPGNNAIGEILTTGQFAPTGTVTPPANCVVTASSASVCEFSITALGGSASADPLGIAVNSGDSSHVYFAENAASRIGVLNVQNGTLAEVPTVTPNAGPTAIVQGPDGAMWFTENNVAKIGRLTTAGQASEYSLTPATSALGLIAASDNNLYFADPAQNKIGSVSAITPSTVNEYAVPTASAFPNQLVIGPDGLIYFTETHGEQDRADDLLRRCGVGAVPRMKNFFRSIIPLPRAALVGGFSKGGFR